METTYIYITNYKWVENRRKLTVKAGEGSKGLCHIDTFPAKSLQSCPTLCDPIDTSPPGSPVPGILQARTLEWGAISFSDA